MFCSVKLFNVEEVGAEDGGEVALEAPVANALGFARGGVDLLDVLVECCQAGCPQQM